MRWSLLFITLILFSCEVQKRRYNKGFYFSKPQQHHEHDLLKETNEFTHELHFGFAPRVHSALPPDSCSLIVFNDGTEVKARIVEQNDAEIKYIYCDDKDGTPHTSRRRTVLRVVDPKHSATATTRQPANNVISTETTATVQEPTVSAPSSAPAPPSHSVAKDTAVKKATHCERVVFRDGTERDVILLEIGIGEIRFKSCDNPDGPVYIKEKSSIFMIVHKDGSKEVMKEEEVKPSPTELNNYNDEPYKRPVRTNRSIITGFIFSLTGFYPLIFVGSLIGIIMSAVYLNKNRENPEVYSMDKMARTTLILSIIGLVIWCAVIFTSL
jgi:hypothetical protein